MEIFPAPFRWPYYIAKWVYKWKKSSKEVVIREDHQKYYQLLCELIHSKQKADLEESVSARNKDLMTDIINELKKMQPK